MWPPRPAVARRLVSGVGDGARKHGAAFNRAAAHQECGRRFGSAQGVKKPPQPDPRAIREKLFLPLIAAALFDDEEIGSKLRQGAAGNFLPGLVERTVEALCPEAYGPSLLGQTYARSFLLSADVSHAGNPNFLNNYLEEHTPKLNVGMVISCDSNGHMTTDGVSGAIMQRTAELCGAKTQLFQIRNDSRSGGTIGPMLSSAMGVRAADCGLPQLSMHSIRATTGALDPGLGVQFFKSFFDNWEKIDHEWE